MSGRHRKAFSGLQSCFTGSSRIQLNKSDTKIGKTWLSVLVLTRHSLHTLYLHIKYTVIVYSMFLLQVPNILISLCSFIPYFKHYNVYEIWCKQKLWNRIIRMRPLCQLNYNVKLIEFSLNGDIFCRFYRITRKQKKPSSKYYLQWGWNPDTFAILAMYATPKLVPNLL